MSIQRVALIFDDKVRPDTTGIYCRRALAGLVEVEHFRPQDLLPRQGFDLYLRIDDSLPYCLPDSLRPRAWWVIDTHLDAERYRVEAPGYDFVFAAQRDGAEARQKAGVRASWLPLACDPDMHARQQVAKTFDVCFIGHVFPGQRAELLELIRQHFPNHLIGQRFFEAMALAYSATRVVFNRSLKNDINMRVFEALACGSLLLTNNLSDNGQAELLQDGVHLATYRDAGEMLEKIRYYLAHESQREQIATTGCALARTRHTYRHRMHHLLTVVEQGLGPYECLRPAARRMVARAGRHSDR